jgi:predicted permease
VRILGKTPGLILSIVLALAVGIGVGVPVLGIIRASLSAPSSYADPLLSGASDVNSWLSGWSSERRTIAEIQDEGFKLLMQIALGLTASLLGIALINVITLLLARGAVRRPEMALRAVLGAERRRLVGQMLIEGTILLLVASGPGILILAAGGYLLRAFWPHGVPPWGSRLLDGHVLALIAAVFVAATLVSWLSPVGVILRQDLRRFLTTGGRATASRGEMWVRNGLAVVQIAASLILLTSAGVLLRGFAVRPEGSQAVEHAPRATLTLRLQPPAGEHVAATRRASFYQEALLRAAQLPGVVNAGLATEGSLAGLGTTDLVHALTGNPTAPGWIRPARYHAVSPGFFQALGVPISRGREFGSADTADAPRVVIVNTAFVNRFRLAGNPIGKSQSLQLHGASLNAPWYRVVGVVEDVRAQGLGSGTEPVPKIYLAALQHPPPTAVLVVRTTAGDPLRLVPLVQEVIRSAEPRAVLSNPITLDEYLEHLRAPLRWFALLFGALAGLALGLAASGLAGVMSYNVIRRTREIGIRMAVGARSRDVTRMVVGQSLRLSWIGSVLGFMGALSLARLLQMLFAGVEPLDAQLYGGIAVALTMVALFASYRPARRAVSVDPQTSLREE